MKTTVEALFELIDSVPRVTIDIQNAELKGEDVLIAYAKAMPEWRKRAIALHEEWKEHPDRTETEEWRTMYNDLLNHHRHVLEIAYDGLLNHHLHDDDKRDNITMRVGQCLSKEAKDRVAFGTEVTDGPLKPQQ